MFSTLFALLGTAIAAVLGVLGYGAWRERQAKAEDARDAAAKVGEQAQVRLQVDEAQRRGGPDAVRERLRRAARERAELRRLAARAGPGVGDVRPKPGNGGRDRR